MKKINTLLLFSFFTLSALYAQGVRYLDEVFDDYDLTANVTYGTNITILPVLAGGNPAPEDLLMNIYTPKGDTATNRPVVALFHTGTFLPQYINGQITGSRVDSSIVEICSRLSKRGYVAIAATYRKGWNPTATGPEGQNERTRTVLLAAYRGIQDLRTLVRFLRKTVAEDGNPYGIDPEKIGTWGMGTGGYLTLGASFLDRFEETLPKFVDTETLLPYVDTNVIGNVYATTQKPLCLPNHVQYSSHFAMCVSVAGALGDIKWIEGDNSPVPEPAVVGFHLPTDPFGPFGNGPVINPVTGDFIIAVHGERTTVDTANVRGVNDVLDPVNEWVSELNQRVAAYSTVNFQFPGQQLTTLATENFYPFVTNGIQASPYDWWDKATLDAFIPIFNMITGQNLSSDTLHQDGLATNPDMSAEKGRRYIDTLMMYYTPRACAVLGFTDCLDALGVVGTKEILTDSDVGLRLAPNPASDVVFLQSNAGDPIQEVRLFDVRGLMVKTDLSIQNNSFELQRGHLPSGLYFAMIRFEKGIITKKIMFR